MIISKTPYRISFFGGGTDYPEWYENHGGAVISTTINKYCYISSRILPPFFDHKYRLVYSNIELVNDIAEIEHPSIKGVLKWLQAKDGLEIQYNGDLPARSGMGSSSAFTVGLLNSMKTLQGHVCSKRELASDAITVERKVINETVGTQDQVAAAYGGFNLIQFGGKNKFTVSPLVAELEKIKILEKHFLLFFSGLQRYSTDIEKSKISNLNKNVRIYENLQQSTKDAQKLFKATNLKISDLGELMNECWCFKKQLSALVTLPIVDEAYQKALSLGALGGKLLGAGGGGFLLLIVKPEDREKIVQGLKPFIHVPFKCEPAGSKIVISDIAEDDLAQR
ncbi:kinase [Alphaproteobacteria bacterium]|nr:kinase [Alphaproteobacteria bacterium]